MAVELKSTLEGTTYQIDKNKAYLVDFSKLQSVNDLMIVLSGLGITFPGNHPLIEHLKPFLKLDTPIDVQQPPQPKKESKHTFIPLRKTDLK